MNDIDVLLEAMSMLEINRASENLAKANVANLQKWGSCPENNILYVCGFSGGGKSTISSLLGELPHVVVVHLDGYLQDESEWTKQYETKSFTAFLQKHHVDFHNVVSDFNKSDSMNEKDRIRLKTLIKSFEQVLDDYSKYAYSKGFRVVVEGLQIGFGVFHSDKSYFADKPMIISSTSMLTSAKRKWNRDQEWKTVPVSKLISLVHKYIEWYSIQNKSLKKLEKNIDLHPYYKTPLNFNV